MVKLYIDEVGRVCREDDGVMMEETARVERITL